MPDLSPDLSPYAALAKSGQGGVGAMDPSSILGLVQRSRDLQSQSAIADALRANPDDPVAAIRSAGQAGAYLKPSDITSATNAASATFELNRNYMREAAGAMGSLVSDPDATVEKFNALAPLLQRYHVPDAMIKDVINSASSGGKLDHDKLVTLYNWITGNAGLPGQAAATVTGPYGTTTVPSGTALRGKQPGAGGAAPGPETPTPPPRGAAGAPRAGAAGAPRAEESSSSAATRETRRSFEGGGYGASGGAVTNPPQSIVDSWNAGEKQYGEANARDYRSDVTPMEKSIEILKKDPNLTGRGKEELNNAKNFLHSLGFIPDKDMASVTEFEQLKKYLAGFANSASMGGTDARMWQQIASSPSVEKLGSTNLSVARMILGLRRMQQVGLKEFDNQVGRDGMPLPPGYFSKWMSGWSARQDPMAFVWDTMSKEEKLAYGRDHWTGRDADGPAANELKRFQDSREAAKRTPGVTSDGQ